MCEARDAVLRFIVFYKMTHDGNSPTYREIMQATGITSTSVVAYHLEILEMEDKIQRPRAAVGNSRVIEVVGGSWMPPGRDCFVPRNPAPALPSGTGDKK